MGGTLMCEHPRDERLGRGSYPALPVGWVAMTDHNSAAEDLPDVATETDAERSARFERDAMPYLESNTLQVAIPSATLMTLVLAVSFLGDGLRDAFAAEGRR